MVEVGFFSLCLGLCLSLYGLGLGVLSAFYPRIGLIGSARNALISVFLCVFLSSLILWNAIFFHDFSVKYVFLHSSIDMPPLYLLTSFWSALEGSHLLWTLLLSFVAAWSLATVKKENEVLYPGLCIAFGLALCFMLFLCVTLSAPFTRLFPVQKFGEGMNALLQNPYMAIHPPMLFTGYALLSVPFAYSFAALIQGKWSAEWLSTVRQWLLLAWIVLSVAIFLGGKWAYVELGWSGYWAWDPVENSSFMPWLAATAALHTLLVTDKTGRLPRLLLFLTLLSFALTFQGTFITRSGIISSVHSFAESDIGPAYLIWVVFLFSITLFLVFMRGHLLPGAAKTNAWRLSKESVLLFTNFFLLFLLVLVFTGTLLPLVVEALRGVKISIQQPFFNAFAPWVGLGLVLLLGVGNLLRWKQGKIEDPVSCLLFPLFWALALSLCLTVRKNFDSKSFITFFFVLWTCFILIMDFIYKLRRLQWNTTAFLKYNRPYLGSFFIHLGFLIAIAGFAGNYRTISGETTLRLHQSAPFQNYIITNEGLSSTQNYNALYVIANLKAVDRQTGQAVMVTPMRSKFTNNEQWFNEIGVDSTFWHDLYVVLASFDVNDQSVSLKISLNPTVKLVWTSLVVMAFGAAIALSHRFRKRSADPQEEDDFLKNGEDLSWQKKNRRSGPQLLLSTLLVLMTLCVAVFGFSGIVHAEQGNTPNAGFPGESKLLQDGSGNGSQLKGTPSPTGQEVLPMTTNPKVVDVAKELRCPTCQGLSVLESGTPQSIAMRTEIEKQLAEGKSKPEIIRYFVERYGTWILREPDTHSMTGLLIWIIPVSGLLFGPFFLLAALRRSKKHQQDREEKMVADIKDFLSKTKKDQDL